VPPLGTEKPDVASFSIVEKITTHENPEKHRVFLIHRIKPIDRERRRNVVSTSPTPESSPRGRSPDGPPARRTAVVYPNDYRSATARRFWRRLVFGSLAEAYRRGAPPAIPRFRNWPPLAQIWRTLCAAGWLGLSGSRGALLVPFSLSICEALGGNWGYPEG
jgi:hypothetical protein